MRIDWLDLVAFGPFTETRLDFSAGNHGLHLVFGNNEAGKSSALRALGDLFYGIPHRTIDAFQHPNPKLRLGARLRKSDQTVFEFVRRKGRTPLRCAKDTKKIDESQLEPFRPVADRELFETMFALNHDRLVQGGRHILEGGGRLGELLFEAGTGLGNLQQVQTRLKDQIDALYLPKGRNPTINKTLTDLKEARDQTKQAMLIADDWNRLSRQLEEKRALLLELDRQILSEESHHQRLLRLQEAIPIGIRHQQVEQELAQLEDVVPVHPEQLREISDRLARRESIAMQLQTLQDRKTSLQEELQATQVHAVAVHEASSLNDYREWLGSYRKALNDRPELETKRRVTEQRIAEALQSLGYDAAQGSQPPAIPKHIAIRIQELGAQYDVVRERLANRRRHCLKLQQQLEQVRAEHDAVSVTDDVTALEHRVAQLPDPCSMQEQYETLRTRRLDIERRRDDRLARLAGWHGSIDDLVRLEVPARETVVKHEGKLSSAQRELQAQEERLAEDRRELEQLGEQLRSLEKGQAIPTEEELSQLRNARDDRWQSIRETLASIDKGTDFSSRRADIDDELVALRTDWKAVDSLSDRLRQEADRVAEKARITNQQASLQVQMQDRSNRLESAQSTLQSVGSDWRSLWNGIVESPLAPEEMIIWLEQYRELCEIHDELRSIMFEQQRLHEQMTHLDEEIDRLTERCFGPDQVTTTPTPKIADGDYVVRTDDLIDRASRLQAFVKHASRLVQQREQLHKRGQDLEIELGEAETASQEAEAEWEQWQVDWREQMQQLQLPEDALPAQAHSVLTSLAEIATQVATVKELDLRLDGIDREAQKFENQLIGLADRLGDQFESVSDSVESLAAVLFEYLEQNVNADRQRARLTTQLDSVVEESRKITSQAAEIDANLQAMCRQLGVEDASRLLETARRGERRAELDTKWEELQETLLSRCGGRSIEQLWEEVKSREADLLAHDGDGELTWNQADVDLLKSRSDSASKLIDELRSKRDDLIRDIERDQTDFERMDGSGDAATREQHVQELQMELAQYVSELQVLRVMEVGLRAAMTRYRDQNELPILNRSAELFTDLTSGRYNELRLDTDDQGEPIIVAVRSSGDIAHVGQMSDGTRDQLYLAIRMASLDQWLENREPMLFVLDDVLLNFDDERAVACLKTFAKYATKTQIIMFTHHAHLVDLARQHLDEQSLFVHELDSGYPRN